MSSTHLLRMRPSFPPASAAFATMAALSTACRAAAFVPSFATNAALLGCSGSGGRARYFAASTATAYHRSTYYSKGSKSNRLLGSSSVASRRLTGAAEEIGDSEAERGSRVGLRMSSSAAQQDAPPAAVEALTASIKAKGDEIRRRGRLRTQQC